MLKDENNKYGSNRTNNNNETIDSIDNSQGCS